MMASWILGALMFSVLCAIAAMSMESVLRLFRRPTRWPWVCAIIAAVVWPLLAPFVLTAPVGTVVTLAMTPIDGALTAGTVASDPWWTAARAAAFDRWLLIGWGLASGLLLAQLVLALRRLQHVRRHAAAAVVDGEEVLLDEHMGPAVIGLFQPRIVLPSWLLGLEAPMRAVVVQHEREHCRAGDSRLVWLSVVATTLLPWNAAIWWMAHRLRTAMEIDCDARTLRSDLDPARYAKLLLLIAQRNGSARFAPMLSHSTSQLARRIHFMHAPIARFRTLRASLAAGIALVAVTASCSSRIASNLTSPAPTPVATAAPAPAVEIEKPTQVPAGQPYFDFQVEVPVSALPGSVGPRYPEALRAKNISGGVLAQFVVNTDGVPDLSTFKAVVSADPAFTASVREALATMRFKPALVGGKPVRQLVQTPFSFMLDGATSVLKTSPVPTPARGASAASPAVTPSAEGGEKPFFDFQVEKPATIRAGAKGPRYPEALREAKVEGQVLAQFIVDANGQVEMGSFKVLKSDHPDFTQAVKEALAAMTFEPAQVKGRAVKQLLQQPFQFSLSR